MAVRSMFSCNLVLMFQFGDKLQIGSLQIGFDPAVDPLVQFRTEVILPIARFPLADELAISLD